MITIREYSQNDIDALALIWNEVVADGVAFPQENELSHRDAEEFFSSQTFTGVAELGGEVAGLYILHPNNVGRCGHICNASYAVKSGLRGTGVGRALVTHSLDTAKEKGFAIMQFNAVVESNANARRLYESLGFVQLGVIPNGFRLKSGDYANICPYYKVL